MGRHEDQLTREERIRVAQGRPIHRTEDRDSHEIKRDIDRTRSAMDETLDQLGERLNPRNLVDDVIEIFRSPQSQDTAKRAGHAAGDFATNLGRQVRDNPIGASLVGAGLAWLAFGNRREDYDARADEYEEVLRRRRNHSLIDPGFDDQQADRFYSEEDLILDTVTESDGTTPNLVVPESYDGDHRQAGTIHRVKSTAKAASTSIGQKTKSAWQSTKDGATSTGEKVGDASSSLGDTISRKASEVADGVRSAASSVSEKASSATSKTSGSARNAYLRSRAASRDAFYRTTAEGRSLGRRAQRTGNNVSDQLSSASDATIRRVQRAHDDCPLALGLGVMALGAIAGALIPRTRREDQWMGETSDELLDDARQAGTQAVQRGRQMVEETADTALQSARESGLTPDSLAERAECVVKETSESLVEAAKEVGLHPQQIKEDIKDVASDTKEQATSEAEQAKADAKAEAEKHDSDVAKAT